MRDRAGGALRAIPTLITGGLLTAASPAPVQSYDSYGSWLVACDNMLTCEAKGFGDGGGRAEMRVDRAAGPDGALSITIRVDSRAALDALNVDGRPLALREKDWARDSNADGTALTTSALAGIRSLVAALRNGTTLTLGPTAAVPLDGLRAALLRVDARQGRIGTVSALTRAGPRPVGSIRPAPAAPRILNRPIARLLAPGEATHLIAQVRRTERPAIAREQCDQDIALAVEAFALDRARALIFIPCFMGAYQESSLAFIAPRQGGRAQRVIARLPYRGNDPAHATAGAFTEAGFDPKTGTLSMFAKERGLADCGVTASWIWSGKAFRLASFSLQQACGGVEPGDWPTLFRSVQE